MCPTFNDYNTSYYGEYDTLKDKQIQMPVKGLIAHYNFYNGDLYCIHADSNNKLSIVKWDINTGDYETIYTPPEGVEGLYLSNCNLGSRFSFKKNISPSVVIENDITPQHLRAGYRLFHNHLYLYPILQYLTCYSNLHEYSINLHYKNYSEQ